MLIAPARRAAIRAFSLLELIAVMAIIVIVAALVMPSVQGLAGSSNLKGSANSLVAQLDLARQTASTRNRNVAVRLYQDTTKSPDTNGNQPYRLLALVIPAPADGSTSDVFITAPQGLPGDVIIDSSTAFSTLLNTGLGATGLRPVAATEAASAPASVRNLPYVQFTFLANGTVNLDSSQQWCLTLINENKALKNPTSGPAANYVTLSISPQTSHVSTYQP
jgi:uncharacterized protein (TIGR02596 family)